MVVGRGEPFHNSNEFDQIKINFLRLVFSAIFKQYFSKIENEMLLIIKVDIQKLELI